jgi:hypothetical protein
LTCNKCAYLDRQAKVLGFLLQEQAHHVAKLYDHAAFSTPEHVMVLKSVTFTNEHQEELYLL